MHNIKSVVTLQGLRTEIEAYGFSFSMKKYLMTLVVCLLGVIFAGWVYRLEPVYYVVVLVAGIVAVPHIIRKQVIYLYRQKHFNDIDVYLHQMAYSFQRKPKIQLALWDTLEVADQNLKELVTQALEIIAESSSENPYREAFDLIESQYRCSRVKALHQFMVRVESSGGSYQNSMNVLVEDIDHWIERIYQMQKDRKVIKRDSTIGIILSFIVADVSLLTAIVLGRQDIGIHINITQSVMYQMITTGFFVFNIGCFVAVQSGFSRDWAGDGRSDKKIMQDYETAYQYSTLQIRKKFWFINAIFLLIAVVLALLELRIAAILAFSIFIYIFLIPSLNKKSAIKRIQSDVQIAFSEWLRDVALNLQYQTLQSSICATYEYVPIILKDSLKRFIVDINSNPSAVTPYYNFLLEFHIMDISSTVKMLYALEDADIADMDKNINNLITRNCTLMLKNEKQVDESRLSVLRFMEYIPMFVASLKLMIDIILILNVAI